MIAVLGSTTILFLNGQMDMLASRAFNDVRIQPPVKDTLTGAQENQTIIIPTNAADPYPDQTTIMSLMDLGMIEIVTMIRITSVLYGTNTSKTNHY